MNILYYQCWYIIIINEYDEDFTDYITCYAEQLH